MEEVVGVAALSKKSTVTHFAVDKAALQTNFIFVEIDQSINKYCNWSGEVRSILISFRSLYLVVLRDILLGLPESLKLR